MGTVWWIAECGGGDVGRVDSWASRDGIPLLPVRSTVSLFISISIYIYLYLYLLRRRVHRDARARESRVMRARGAPRAQRACRLDLYV